MAQFDLNFVVFQIVQYAYEPVIIRRNLYALVYKDAVSGHSHNLVNSYSNIKL